MLKLEKALISGSLMTSNITLGMLDDQRRDMITDNTSIAIMSTLSSNVTVMKSKSVKANQGKFRFDDVIVVGPPGSEILLKINTDSINIDRISKAYP